MQKLVSLLTLSLLLTACSGSFQTSDLSDSASSGITSASIVVPATPQGKAGYPFYMPMDHLIQTSQFYFEISCSLSNAAGELRTKNNTRPEMSNASVYTGVTFVYEAPCTYGNMEPGGIRNWKWAAGSQVIHRTSVRGQKAIFITNNPWHALHVNPGTVGVILDTQGDPTDKLGGRFHTEITDIEFYNSSGEPMRMGSLHFEVFPSADSGVLATLVVRDSKFGGGKNALFMPSGSVMLYAVNSEFSRSHGTNVDQEHVIYINGILMSHFENTKIYGDRGSGPYGGHQLKVKSGIVVLESVSLSNGGGDYQASNRPLYDGAAQAYVWSENLSLERVATDTPRDSLVDLRRTAYTSSLLKWPMETALGADMGIAAPGCARVKPEFDEYYLQVFKKTVVKSAYAEKSVFRQNGFIDTIIGSSDGATSYEEAIANPTRNRAWLFSFDTQHQAERITQDAFFYLQPDVATYHCENPSLPAGLKTLVDDKTKFIAYALYRFQLANPGMYPLL